MDLSSIHITADLGAMGLAIATAIVGAVALVQYINAERWKRLEFSITQINKLMQDPSLSFCCQVIDWDCGPLIIPEKYSCLFPPGQRVIQHDRSLLARALRPLFEDGWESMENQAQFLLYRYTFEEFFSYVNAVAMYRDVGIVKRIDLGPLEYYLALLKEPVSKNQNAESGNVFMGLIREYYSHRVLPWVEQADWRGIGIRSRSVKKADSDGVKRTG
jgi:hypothetical protein